MAAVIHLDPNIGNWPRRLLHVPTLTSYEWQPGNIYGNTLNPHYNAVSYTWGRWKLSTHESPHVRPLHIHNCPWELPRINPSHFTAKQLVAVIQQARGWRISTSKGGGGKTVIVPEVDWIWIDIACIDQSGKHPSSNAEKGRQAAILSKAKRVFAWVSSVSSTDMDKLHGCLRKLDAAYQSSQLFHHTYTYLHKLLSDPWFSSLWTLQEASLRPDTILLSRGAKLLPLSSHRPPTLADAFCVRDLTNLAVQLKQMRSDSTTVLPASANKISALLRTAGISAIAIQNPVAVYIAATHRRTKLAQDTIYGIQQVFGFALGNTAPGYAATHWTPDQLSAQLSDHLLTRLPALSQMFIHSQITAIGSAWRIHRTSIFPQLPLRFATAFGSDNVGNRRKPTCELSAVVVHGSKWSRIKGYTCSFDRFYGRCMDTEVVLHAQPSHFKKDRCSFAVYLDVATETACCLERANTADPIKQRRLLRWLSRSFPLRDQLVVMEMQSVHSKTGMITMGLLLLKKQGVDVPYFRRVGICMWEGFSSRSMRERYPHEWRYQKEYMG